MGEGSDIVVLQMAILIGSEVRRAIFSRTGLTTFDSLSTVGKNESSRSANCVQEGPKQSSECKLNLAVKFPQILKVKRTGRGL